MGSTIGRQRVGFRAATKYWVAPDRTIQLSYRNIALRSSEGSMHSNALPSLSWLQLLL
jgi:hypothetical protein